MLGEQTRAALRRTVEEALSQRASSMTQTRILTLLDAMPNDRAEAEAVLKKIRIAVKLFVDEKLADELFAQLQKIVRS